MSRLENAFTRLLGDLRTLRLRWALVGGMAVSVRARPRTTEDLDIAIAVENDREAEKVAAAFRHLGYLFLRDHALEQTEVGRLATVRLASPGSQAEGGVIVDLLFASSGIEHEVVEAAESLEILPGVVVPVARTGHLIALKVLAGRDIDARDARWLWEAAGEDDRQLARDLLVIITERHFNRGKDLAAELAKVLVEQE